MRWILEHVLLTLLVLQARGRGVVTPSSGDTSKQLRVATLQEAPYVWFRWEPGLIGNERYEGFYVDILQALAEEHGAMEYRLHLVADGKVGRWTPEDGWSGMLGEIQRGSADLCLGAVAMTAERMREFTFSAPLREFHLSILTSLDAVSGGGLASFADLVDNPQIEAGVIRGSDTELLLQQSESALLRRVWLSIEQRNQAALVSADNMFEALERIRGRGPQGGAKYALVIDSEIAQYYISQRPCDLVMVDRVVTGVTVGFAVANGSSFLPELNQVLSEVSARAAPWRRQRDRWWRHQCGGGGGGEDDVTESEALVSSPADRRPQRSLRVATVLMEPYFMRSLTPRGERFEGYMVDLVTKMAAGAGFLFEWVIKEDLGRRRGRKQWTGVIGALLDGEADFGAAPFEVAGSSKRESRVLDFTRPYLHSTLALLLHTDHAALTNDGQSEEGDDHRSGSIYFLEDVLNQTSLAVGVVRGSRAERILRRSKLEFYQQIWERVKETPAPHRHGHGRHDDHIFASLPLAVASVRAGHTALLLDSTDANYIASSQAPCDLVALDQFLSVTNYGFALEKGNPLAGDLDLALLSLQEDGELQRLFHKWFFPTDACFNTGAEAAMVTAPLPPLDNIDGTLMTEITTHGLLREDRHSSTPTSTHRSPLPFFTEDSTLVYSTTTSTISVPSTTSKTGRVKSRRRNMNKYITTETVHIESLTSTAMPSSTQTSLTPRTLPNLPSELTTSSLPIRIVIDGGGGGGGRTRTQAGKNSNDEDVVYNNDNGDDEDIVSTNNNEDIADRSYEWFFQTEIPRPEELEFEYLDSMHNSTVNSSVHWTRYSVFAIFVCILVQFL